MIQKTKGKRSLRQQATVDYIGKRLYYTRTRLLKASRTQIASLLGITHQQLQKYETGKNRIGVDMLLIYAEAFCLPIEYFFPPPKQKKPLLTDEIMRYATELSKLTNAQQDSFLQVAKLLAVKDPKK